LIGVIPKIGQENSAREFFELFKTPWEFYRPEAIYDVVVATADQVPETGARVLIIFGASANNIDLRTGNASGRSYSDCVLSRSGVSIPIYCGARSFIPEAAVIPCAQFKAEIGGFKTCDGATVRFGYDLFQEVEYLLSSGQPEEWADVPTLDLHIDLLRQTILEAGVGLIEIPPAPSQKDFIVCLTHDVDFIGIKDHFLDHSMWGFCFRATIGALQNFLRGRLSFDRLLKCWLAVLSLPFVYLGWAKDFWLPFEWYLEAEKDLPSTYFLIPFKRTQGEKVSASNGARRATAYDVKDLPQWIPILQQAGCEVGVHGIDSWHSKEKGRQELNRVAQQTGASKIGIRMHWLLADSDTHKVLDEAGYDYDSTIGYNGTIGFRAGTSQVFRPAEAQTLLELPLHIQDGALFFPEKLGLSNAEAKQSCGRIIDQVRKLGGVLTLLWHDRSHAAERFWGDFYLDLLKNLRGTNCWFATAEQAVAWFRSRRSVHFSEFGGTAGQSILQLHCDGAPARDVPFTVRFYYPKFADERSSGRGSDFEDISWDGLESDSLDRKCREFFHSSKSVATMQL
jgi:hypothetical protein